MLEKSKENISYLDNLSRKAAKERIFDLPLAQYVKKYKSKTIHFSKKGISKVFYTQDSGLYYTPLEYRMIRDGKRIARVSRRVDSLNSRDFERTKIYSIGQSDVTFLKIKRKYSGIRVYCLDAFENSIRGVSPVKMWNMSLVGAVIFGMLTMTMIYRYLGGSVSAKIQESNLNSQQQVELVEEKAKPAELSGDIDPEFITNLLKDYQENEEEGVRQKEIYSDIMAMVKGYPIEQMVPEIAKRDRMIAALLVAIARKESSWGVHVPVLNGKDCYNYWGYRGIRDKMGTGGHTCFDSPKDAVDTVAKRIETLVKKEKLNTAAKMVVWKCGYDCSWDSKTAVQKWISDVDFYFQKLNK